jgi:hypothetical protein
MLVVNLGQWIKLEYLCDRFTLVNFGNEFTLVNLGNEFTLVNHANGLPWSGHGLTLVNV